MMKTSREHLIEVFSQLGLRLDGFGSDERSKSDNDWRGVAAEAVAANPWFTTEDIVTAVRNIRRYMLDERSLREWLEAYPGAGKQLNIGVITAGNIPLVGFFDILCVLISGHRLHLKAASKDAAMTEYIIGLLLEIDPHLPISRLVDEFVPDALIATGSDNTNRYFRTLYGEIPSILRGSRSSVAVLTGNEQAEELELLSHDIFSYSGLGCRNVSHLIVPEGYLFDTLLSALSRFCPVNTKLINNYRQRAAMLTTGGTKFERGPFFLLRYEDSFPSYISEITWHYSSGQEQTAKWLADNERQIQCVVNYAQHPRGVRFGQSQSPGLADYPDAVDTMAFLALL